ncbi:MAG: nuclease-related domain-containing protein [Elusimicrobia bacterium]|nr:nuclease-related domain-containing protein [Elusimicrobiota bacterium]
MMFKKPRARHSPLKDPPLRYAGQSLDNKIERLTDEILEYAQLPFVLCAFAVFEWWRWYFRVPPLPLFLTVVAILLCGYSAIRIIPLWRQRHNYGQGRDGERYVGQQLEALHAQGFKVLHDICNGHGNIDHVLIGQKGIFTIETKTISKPDGQAEVQYDGKSVVISGFTPDSDPIAQAMAESKWLRGYIRDCTGKDFPVRPVVLYTGWMISKQPRDAEVWVLSGKELPAFLQNEDPRLTPGDVELAYACLCHYVRSTSHEFN